MNVAFLTAAEEHALALQAQAGDVEARNRIVLGIWPLICRQAHKLAVKHRRDREDLAQAGVLKVLAEFRHFDPSRGLRACAYFGRVAVVEMAHFAMHADRLMPLPYYGGVQADALRVLSIASLDARHGEEGASIGDMPAGRSRPPDEEAAAREEGRRLRECIRALPPKRRVIAEMMLQGMTCVEIAERLKTSRQRIKQNADKAIEQIRRMMVPHDENHLPAPLSRVA